MKSPKRIRAEFNSESLDSLRAENVVAQVLTESTAANAALIAKKDFEISHNAYHRKIKKGDDLADVPELYHANLRTEQVL